MRTLIGVGLVLLGVALGLYLGVWWAFIGGIIGIITEIKSPNINALNFALDIVRIMSAGLIGWFFFAIFTSIGLSILKD